MSDLISTGKSLKPMEYLLGEHAGAMTVCCPIDVFVASCIEPFDGIPAELEFIPSSTVLNFTAVIPDTASTVGVSTTSRKSCSDSSAIASQSREDGRYSIDRGGYVELQPDELVWCRTAPIAHGLS